MLTDNELALIAKANEQKALLAPMQEVMKDWGIQTRHQFQTAIRDLHLVSTGELEDDWRVRVYAGTTGVVVAEFSFKEYGRYFDMRYVSRNGQIPVGEMEKWIQRKMQQGVRFTSSYAEDRGLSYTDARVVRDLAWRMSRTKSRLPRRRWYNKTKEIQLQDLYDQLMDAAARVAVNLQKQALTQ